VALVGLDAAAFDVVPEADAGVERPGEDEFAVGREADRGHGVVVFVDESAEALAGCCVPDAAVLSP